MAKKMYPVAVKGFEGINTRFDPLFLSPSQAQTATDCDIYDGTLSGTPDVSGIISSTGSTRTKWLALAGGGTWVWSDDTRYSMNDGAYTYSTQVGKYPAIFDGQGNSTQLGVGSPQGATWSFGTTGWLSQTIAFGISYQTFDGLESNIQAFDLIFAFPIGANDKITFSSVWPADVRVSAVRLWAAVVTAGVTGTYYLQQTIRNRGTTTIVVDTNPVTTGTQLTWLVGGFPSNTLYTSDHSPAPVLTRLADRIHSVASGTAVAGSGIIFGSIGNILRWSANGYPQYWPTVNSMPLDGQIEALIAYTGYTAIFTTSGTYSIAGNNDDQMSLQRLDAAFNIQVGAGPSCLRTPVGTLFVAPEGLALFDGASTQILSAGKIALSYFSGLTYYAAAYFNQKFYLFHSSGYLVCDLREGVAGARFNTSATVIQACANEDFKTPVVGVAQRPIPLEVSATAIGLRRFGFTMSNNTLYLVGGTKIDTSGGTSTGEVALSTAYTLTPSTASGIWTDIGPLSGSELRCNMRAVAMASHIYCQGGNNGITSGVSTTYSTMQDYNIGTGAWSVIAGGPQRAEYGAVSDTTTGLDGTNLWLVGGTVAAGSPSGVFQNYNFGTSSWSAVTVNSGTTPAVCGHGMVWVPASVFADNQARLFTFGGSTTATNGGLSSNPASAVNTVSCFNLSTGAWTDDATSDGGASSATAAGVGARVRMVWIYDHTSRKIFLHGGAGTDSSGLSDLWEFDPLTWVNAGSGARVTAWVNHADAVVNVDDRYWHGGAFANPNTGAANSAAETLYLAGGTTQASFFASDIYAVEVDALEEGGTTRGLYVVRASDNGSSNIRRLEGGSAQSFVWRTGDFEGEFPTTYKHAQRLKIDYQGQIVVASYSDNGAVQTLLTLQSATRVQTTVWLPSGLPTYSATKTEPGNTTSVINAFAGPANSGTVVLSVEHTSAPVQNILKFGTGVAQTFSVGFVAIPWPVTLVGGPNEGTITITDSGGPPGGGADGTYTDNVTVTNTANAVARGKRLSFQFTGSAYSGTSAKLWSAEFEIVEEHAA